MTNKEIKFELAKVALTTCQHMTSESLTESLKNLYDWIMEEPVENSAWSDDDKKNDGTTAGKEYENESLAELIRKVDWLDVLNNKNSKVRRRGYAKTFARVCSSYDINTIKDLLKFGSYNLRDARNMGAANLAIVSEALYLLYGIDKW